MKILLIGLDLDPPEQVRLVSIVQVLLQPSLELIRSGKKLDQL